MCGRYTLGKEPNSLLDYFHLHGEVPTYHLSYNIAPSQMVPVVLADQQQRVCKLMRWGLIPAWSKGPDARFNMINARADSIEQKPAYRAAYQQRRCLVPADGYYEWTGNSKPKQPYFIYQPDSPLFAFAGIWEHWQGEQQNIDSFSIITTDANQQLQSLHHRMPVMVKPDDFDHWLLNDKQSETYKNILSNSCDEIKVDYYPVSMAVNSTKNDSVSLIERA